MNGRCLQGSSQHPDEWPSGPPGGSLGSHGPQQGREILSFIPLSRQFAALSGNSSPANVGPSELSRGSAFGAKVPTVPRV